MKIKCRIFLWLFVLSLQVCGQSRRMWVFFMDKPASSLNKSSGDLGVSQKALKRRAKMADHERVTDNHDLPVSDRYLDVLRSLGCRIHVKSRWLNGVSISATPETLKIIRALEFVRQVHVVGGPAITPIPASAIQKAAPWRFRSHALDYGPGLAQVEQIRIPEVHDLGINATGVLIGMIDTGFEHDFHEALRGIDVIAEYDFHWDDDITSNQPNDSPGQHDHGTQTLSVIGGYVPGRLIGPAYGAQFALAKTEWLPTETRIEEDHWVAGIEWLEALGVDVVSSSLGYNDFVDDGFAYTYDDLDGQTCVTTRAAEIAAQKGVVVVNSAGNEQRKPWRYITSPADGPNVIAVGAVDMDGNLANFSSIGPTADGRIKPDVIAMGLGCYMAKPSANDPSRYVFANGTSFSCPLVAGVCALILQARPELTPSQVRDALVRTADRADSPDNEYGYGLIDAYEALFYHGPVLHDFSVIYNGEQAIIAFHFSTLYNRDVLPQTVRVFASSSQFGALLPIPVQSVQIHGKHIFQAEFHAPVPSGAHCCFYFTLKDVHGESHRMPLSGVYRLSRSGEGIPLVVKSPQFSQLLQNYPNPFHSATTIPFTVREPVFIDLSVYNTTGQRVKQIARQMHDAGEYRYAWNALDDAGRFLPTGMYVAVMHAGKFVESRKMLLVR